MGFHVVRESYYSQVVSAASKVLDNVVLTVGLYSTTGGGCQWEFIFTEEQDGALRLRMFDEAWVAFAEMPEFFAGLAALGRGAAVEDVVGLMQSSGFRDFTDRGSVGVTVGAPT